MKSEALPSSECFGCGNECHRWESDGVPWFWCLNHHCKYYIGDGEPYRIVVKHSPGAYQWYQAHINAMVRCLECKGAYQPESKRHYLSPETYECPKCTRAKIKLLEEKKRAAECGCTVEELRRREEAERIRRQREQEKIARETHEKHLRDGRQFLKWAKQSDYGMSDSELLKKCEDLALKLFSREQYRKSIRKLGLSMDDDHFLTNTYSQRYYRTAHCYKCKETLDNSLDNECADCGWIVCRCGACGCGYGYGYDGGLH